MSREYHSPPGHEPSVKALPLFRERVRSGQRITDAQVDVLMALFHRHGMRSVHRHQSRIRAVLARHAGGRDEQRAA